MMIRCRFFMPSWWTLMIASVAIVLVTTTNQFHHGRMVGAFVIKPEGLPLRRVATARGISSRSGRDVSDTQRQSVVVELTRSSSSSSSSSNKRKNNDNSSNEKKEIQDGVIDQLRSKLFGKKNDDELETKLLEADEPTNKQESFFFKSLFQLIGKSNSDDDDDGGIVVSTTRPVPFAPNTIVNEINDDVDDIETSSASTKFDMEQRVESLKSVVLGALAGGIALTPVAFAHYVAFGGNNLAQWEFTTDMSSLEAGLFAIVYRYAVRRNDDNPMLNQGVIGAFAITRTLSNIQVSKTCSAIPLSCGEPLGYVDWNMISQLAWNGVESAALFGVTSIAMEFAYKKGWIQKFG
jgi:hypothetical protein